MPLDRCLIETDSPYLAPVPHRGKVNTPAWVPHVAHLIAELKGISNAEVADAILFLSGAQATYLTGQTLFLDDGVTAG